MSPALLATAAVPLSAARALAIAEAVCPLSPLPSTDVVACHQPDSLTDMSKRTSKKKAKVRRSKANHGRKPNAGRNS